jgi:hypothetical protein
MQNAEPDPAAPERRPRNPLHREADPPILPAGNTPFPEKIDLVLFAHNVKAQSETALGLFQP